MVELMEKTIEKMMILIETIINYPFGNGKHTTFENGDDWRMVLMFVLATLDAGVKWFQWENHLLNREIPGVNGVNIGLHIRLLQLFQLHTCKPTGSEDGNQWKPMD